MKVGFLLFQLLYALGALLLWNDFVIDESVAFVLKCCHLGFEGLI